MDQQGFELGGIDLLGQGGDQAAIQGHGRGLGVLGRIGQGRAQGLDLGGEGVFGDLGDVRVPAVRGGEQHPNLVVQQDELQQAGAGAAALGQGGEQGALGVRGVGEAHVSKSRKLPADRIANVVQMPSEALGDYIALFSKPIDLCTPFDFLFSEIAAVELV